MVSCEIIDKDLQTDFLLVHGKDGSCAHGVSRVLLQARTRLTPHANEMHLQKVETSTRGRGQWKVLPAAVNRFCGLDAFPVVGQGLTPLFRY